MSEAATMMMDEGYKMVTPFFIEDGGKAGTYSWEYVNAHPGCPYQIMFRVVV